MVAHLLAQRGDCNALTARADAGDEAAAASLAELLAQRGDVDALTARAGDAEAARALYKLLDYGRAKKEDEEEAERRRWVDEPIWYPMTDL